MLRENVNDLLAFLAVARERSFTKAAAKLGMSQSGLSHIVRGLEERLGVRLLTRTTRSVAPTPEGEHLLKTIGPRFEEIEGELVALTDKRERPAGTIRITAEDYAIDHVLWPKLRKILHDYPDIKVEFVIDYGLTDIVAERFDAGVRLGEIVSQGMIAVRISPEQRMIVIGSPDYLERNPAPITPQELTRHQCINLRLPTRGGLYAWEFEKDGEDMRVRVDGQMTCNGITQIRAMAVDGFGLGFIPDGLAMPEIEAGRLVQVLADWCPHYPGYHLYYPSRRQSSTAFNIVVDALRERG
ncbi:LysR family transcriptional regulator [Rhizobium leguminosarum]|uniref:LysR family transcriptional regulator n=1 Tax=Rhizobium leguminosarum TaxID=384 RepID=UPI00103C7550|nr:LysR family transcriptional regulator [Rhizobium leguminosarum]MBY5393230.1 LysR family transcriptional regulator [Rhizobium leguminosarum]TBZ85591.1 LysR family transcriptional regulator [Rhizobium leguminosarum bv. viciae]